MNTTIQVKLTDDAGEIWRGRLRDFYRSNDMTTASGIRFLHGQIRKHGNAIVGGGAAGNFMLAPVCTQGNGR